MTEHDQDRAGGQAFNARRLIEDVWKTPELLREGFDALQDEIANRAFAAGLAASCVTPEPAKKCVICGGELAKCEAAGRCVGPPEPAALRELSKRWLRDANALRLRAPNAGHAYEQGAIMGRAKQLEDSAKELAALAAGK